MHKREVYPSVLDCFLVILCFIAVILNLSRTMLSVYIFPYKPMFDLLYSLLGQYCLCLLSRFYVNSFNASCSKLQLFKGFSAILV